MSLENPTPDVQPVGVRLTAVGVRLTAAGVRLAAAEKSDRKVIAGMDSVFFGDPVSELGTQFHQQATLPTPKEIDMDNFAKEDLIEALRAINSLISKCEKAQEKLSQGTSQWTLLKNRIKALRISSSLILKALEE